MLNTIVWQLRLPRVCIAATVGASLALCGAMLQGMLRNPLVDPYLTGVSAAAAAAIAIAILAGAATAAITRRSASSPGSAPRCSSRRWRAAAAESTANRLILAGVSLSTLFAAIVTLAIVRAQSNDYASTIVAWLAGSMAGRGWHDLAIAGPYAVAGALLAFWAVAPLNALRIGELRARAVGVDVDRAQWIILAASSLLAASSVVLAGLVGFIGLIVPHIARRVVGSDARALLPGVRRDRCRALHARRCGLPANRRACRTSHRRAAGLHRRAGVPLSLSSSRDVADPGALPMIELRGVALRIGGRTLLEGIEARVATRRVRRGARAERRR